jgi:Parvulin-like peptidyl-prolyl isomerase
MSQNKRRLLSARIAVVMLILMLVAACGGNKQAAEDDRTVAVYKLTADAAEEQTITLAQFNRYMNVNMLLNPLFMYYGQDPAFRQSMLEQYVALKILGSRIDESAYQKTVDLAEADYESFMDYFAESVGGKNEMNKQLKEIGITGDDIKDYVITSALASEYLSSTVSDDQVKEEYDGKVAEDPNAYVTTATVSHILIGTVDPMTREEKRTKEEALALANEVLEKLRGGADFAAMAKQYSEDESSKDNGGMYKDANINEWVENFRKAVLELPLRQVSEPVETEYGYHLIRVEDRKVPTFDEVKEQVRTELVQLAFADFMENEFPDLLVSTDLPVEDTGETDDGAAGDAEDAGDTEGSGSDNAGDNGDASGTAGADAE